MVIPTLIGESDCDGTIIPDIQFGALLCCKISKPYMNPWCRSDHSKDYGGCRQCFVIFLEFYRSKSFPMQIWAHIMWLTPTIGYVSNITPRALLTSFEVISE